MPLHQHQEKAVRRQRGQHSEDSAAAPTVPRLIQLQPLVGNRGMQRLISDGTIDTPTRKSSQWINRQDATTLADMTETASTDTTFEGKHTILHFGAQGKEVFFLQRRLNLFGAKLVEDGIWGKETHKAVLAFQQSHTLAADGAVGPLTWAELEHAPDNSKLDKDSPIDLTSEDQRMGGFKNFVDQGVLSKDIAFLLNEMFRFPGNYTHEMAQFAHKELSSGKLVGFVRLSESEKIKSKLATKHHKQLAADVAGAAPDGINAVTRGINDGNTSRSYILFKDAELNKATSGTKDERDFVVLELSHELTHHRNGVQYDQEAYKELPTSPNAKEFFVDVKRAQKFENTNFVRAGFIDELVARHVAWHVDQERLPPSMRSTLQPLQYYKAALNFGRSFTLYGDNGYMKDLSENEPALFREQVARWVSEMVKRQYHSDAKENTKRQIFFESVFLAAVMSGFDEPSAAPDGDI